MHPTPLTWVSPAALYRGAGPLTRGRFILRIAEFRHGAMLLVEQSGRELFRRRYRRLTPTLPIHVPHRWVADVDFSGGPVTFSVLGG